MNYTFAACSEPADYDVSNAISDFSEPLAKFNHITVQNQYIDQLYGSTALIDNSSSDFDYPVPDGWGYGTIFNADFEKDISGGNITYSSASIAGIKIKRKFIDEEEWQTIYYKTPIKSSEDFQLQDANGNRLIDFLEPNHRTVQYMYVPRFKAGTEATADFDLNSAVITVNSEFDADMIVGRNTDDVMISYPARLNEQFIPQRNGQTQSVVTMGSKYPFINSNGLADYYTGSMTALFILMDEDCILHTEKIRQYRRDVDTFLNNKIPKLIKTEEGDVYMVATTDAITHENSDRYYDDTSSVVLMPTSFNWTEIGDYHSVGDLYDNDFINTDIDREVSP